MRSCLGAYVITSGLVIVVGAVCMVLVGCGDDDANGGVDAAGLDAGVSEAGLPLDGSSDASDANAPPVPPRVRFVLPAEGAPAVLDVPFPTDLYRTGPGGTIAPTFGTFENLGASRMHDTIASGLIGLDGFGRTVGGMFLVEGDHVIDPSSLIAGESFAIMDVDPLSPEMGSLVPSEAGFIERLDTLVVQPARTVLQPGRRYAVVVTTAVRTMAGEPLVADADLRAILQLHPDMRNDEASRFYGSALDELAARGIAAEEVAGLSVFTTQTRHRLLHRVRAALVAGAYGDAPQLDMESSSSSPYPVTRFGADPHDGWTATLTEWLGEAPDGDDGRDLPGFPGFGLEEGIGTAHDAIGAVLNGTMTSPELRRPFARTSSVEDGTFELDDDGLPRVVEANARVPITLVLPLDPPPPSGWPVVMFGHGTPTHRSYVMSVANELARAGFAVAAIDAPDHGMRADGAGDEGNSFTGAYAGPDGLADELSYLESTLASVGHLQSFARGRDTRAQTIVDYLQLRRLLENPALDLGAAADQYGDVPPRIDGTRIGWAGVSFGGVNGMILAAVEPEIDAFFLDVGGGLEWVTLGESPANLPQVDVLFPAFGLPRSREMRFSRFNPVLSMLQIMYDSVDPASFAAEATIGRSDGGPHIYMIEVHQDELVPNYGTEVVAAQMGLPQIAASAVRVPGLTEITAPVAGNAGGRTQALLVQTLATHGRNVTSRYGTRTAETPFPREDASLDERIVYLEEPVEIRQPVIATQRSMVEFFRTAFDGDEAPPVIGIDGMEHFIDFDDDGFTDDEERAAGTSPFDPASRPAGPPTHPRDVGF